MPDVLWLSGGGSTMVGTDVMFADAHTIENLSIALQGADSAMSSAVRLHPTGAGVAADAVIEDLESARAHANSARSQADQLSYNLRLAMTNYGENEARLQQAFQDAAAAGGFFAGATVATYGMLLGPWSYALAGMLPWLVRDSLGSDGSTIGAEDMHGDPDQNLALSDPNFVTGLRYAASSADEFVFGLGGIPLLAQQWVKLMSGTDGVANTAALVAMYGAFGGMFRETPVSVQKTGDSFAQPVNGFLDRIERIPDPATSPGGAQIRIDRISVPGGDPSFEVYISGTEDFNPVSAGTPFDLTSTVSASAGLPEGSLRAVQLAMADAGITSDSPVTFTGYSQGGLLAVKIASSGDWNTAGLVTIGAPAGDTIVPPGFPAVLIEHDEDLVTALGGVQQNDDALIVHRRLWETPADIPTDMAVPGHRLPNYLETVRLMDESPSPELIRAASTLDALSTDHTVTSSYYRASRD